MSFDKHRNAILNSESVFILLDARDLLAILDNQKPKKYISASQASEDYDLSIGTIYNKHCKGELPALKTGKKLLFNREEIEKIFSKTKKSTNE